MGMLCTRLLNGTYIFVDTKHNRTYLVSETVRDNANAAANIQYALAWGHTLDEEVMVGHVTVFSVNSTAIRDCSLSMQWAKALIEHHEESNVVLSRKRPRVSLDKVDNCTLCQLKRSPS
jgi:hypothetical protein